MASFFTVRLLSTEEVLERWFEIEEARVLTLAESLMEDTSEADAGLVAPAFAALTGHRNDLEVSVQNRELGGGGGFTSTTLGTTGAFTVEN